MTRSGPTPRRPQDAPPWWGEAVIYQLYPLTFQDSDGDGIGDLAGIIRRLDYLAGTLGVDAVWLAPVFPSPMADGGYDVADYTDIDPRLGDLATFDRLLDEAHRRGLRVILDWVPNHTSDRHPWFLESRSSRDNPRRDWYIWRDPAPGGGPPNNWVSTIQGPAWTLDGATGQYYLHSYLPEQPDLNWRHPPVPEAMFDVLRFWLDRGVDGFRIDVAHRILKDPELRDNPPNPERISDYHKPMGPEYLDQLHVHDRAHPDVHAVYRELRRLLDAYEGDRVALGEIHLADLREWARFYGQDRDELHLPLNFRLLHAAWEPASIRAAVEQVEAVLPGGAVPTLVLGNHDDHRLATRIGDAQARVAAVLLLTLRGVPLVYQGDELGMHDVEVPAELGRDRFGRPGGRWSRDGARTPMPWSPGRNAGFTAPDTPRLWLPVGPDAHRRNVAAQLADPTSLLNLYRRLLAYRRRSPVLRRGTYQAVEGVPDDCFVYLRERAGERVLVALNLSNQPQTVRLPASGHVTLSSVAGRAGPVGRTLELAGDEGVCVELAGSPGEGAP